MNRTKWVDDALYTQITRTAITQGAVPIGVIGRDYLEDMGVFDVVSEWGNEYGKRVSGITDTRVAPCIHMSRTFMRRFKVGEIIKFEKISKEVVRMSRAGPRTPARGGIAP